MFADFGVMECEASSYMTNVTMRRKYLTIWDAFVDTLHYYVFSDPEPYRGHTSFLVGKHHVLQGSHPGLFGRVHMLSKYPKATSVSWALDENEKQAPLEHIILQFHFKSLLNFFHQNATYLEEEPPAAGPSLSLTRRAVKPVGSYTTYLPMRSPEDSLRTWPIAYQRQRGRAWA